LKIFDSTRAAGSGGAVLSENGSGGITVPTQTCISFNLNLQPAKETKVDIFASSVH